MLASEARTRATRAIETKIDMNYEHIMSLIEDKVINGEFVVRYTKEILFANEERLINEGYSLKYLDGNKKIQETIIKW